MTQQHSNHQAANSSSSSIAATAMCIERSTSMQQLHFSDQPLHQQPSYAEVGAAVLISLDLQQRRPWKLPVAA